MDFGNRYIFGYPNIFKKKDKATIIKLEFTS